MGYSQNNEEEIILKYFEVFTGKLIDIGANDGKTFSNSLALIEKGWSAELYEPSPGAFKACQLLHKGNKKVKVINRAVSDREGEFTFYDCADSLLSSTNKILAESWNSPITEIKVKAVPYQNTPCDFISIDAEGMDLIILKQIDLTDVRMVCIEHGHVFEWEARKYCEQFGMELLLRNYENIIMAI